MQEFNRKKNTTRNIVWGLIGKGASILGPFITRTFLIYKLGVDYLGINSLYASILSVLSLAELGFASAVVYSMYKPVADGNVEEVACYLVYFKRVYRVVGAVILGMGLALLPALGLLVKGELPSDVNMQIAFLIYLANTTISYFLFAYKQSLLNAYQRKDAISKVSTAVMVLQCFAQCILLVAAPNFYTYAIILPICTIISNLFISGVTDKLFPEYGDERLRELNVCPLGSDKRAGIRKRVAGLIFSRLCSVSRNSFDNIIISAFIGLSAVACYGNYYVVMSGVLGVLGTIASSMTAAVGNSVAVDSEEKNFNNLRMFAFLYAILAIVCSACLITCYQPFMELWVGEELVLPMGIAVLMVVYFYVCTMGDMRSVYVDATGIWWELRWRALAEAIANIVLNLILVQVFGLYGVVLATLISLFAINFVYGSHLTFKFYFGLQYAKQYYLDHLLYLGIAIAVCVGVYFITALIPNGGIWNLLLKAGVALLCSSVMLICAFGWTKRFRAGLSFVKSVIDSK